MLKPCRTVGKQRLQVSVVLRILTVLPSSGRPPPSPVVPAHNAYSSYVTARSSFRTLRYVMADAGAAQTYVNGSPAPSLRSDSRLVKPALCGWLLVIERVSYVTITPPSFCYPGAKHPNAAAAPPPTPLAAVTRQTLTRAPLTSA